ncbi:hypothetical protein [Xanthomonas sp. XNM01]|uniref:hypothetical protein n=1 Tax=Xanthomonas sp. XNM01 TaxID=2769289 RepID=UPI001784E1D7|nr:hypothetical protein [Xanthomonas sp. XNM01]MBD9368115.1 hypothetical protein [Xanthomonas sp. XNM01]
MTRHTDAPGSDTLLLEALFQLAFSGTTEGWEFERINAEVYDRLKSAYPPPRISGDRWTRIASPPPPAGGD